MRTVNTFKIGADPEYIALNKDGTHLNIKSYTTRAAEVAWDHKGDVLEVKPLPSRYAFRLVKRIRKLLLEHEVSRELLRDGLKFRGGAYFKIPRRVITMGGHIHFDVPFADDITIRDYGLIGNNDASFNLLNDKNKKRVKALDCLTRLLESIDILPQKESIKRHRAGNGDWSKYSAIRCGNNHNHLEYRSMCSWLHSPVAALICLTGAKLVAAHPEIEIEEDLRKYFEKFKNKDIDAARVCERIFEPKLKLEARIDLNIQDTWKSLRQLGGVGEIGSAL